MKMNSSCHVTIRPRLGWISGRIARRIQGSEQPKFFLNSPANLARYPAKNWPNIRSDLMNSFPPNCFLSSFELRTRPKSQTRICELYIDPETVHSQQISRRDIDNNLYTHIGNFTSQRGDT